MCIEHLCPYIYCAFTHQAKHCECLELTSVFFATILLVAKHLLCFYCTAVKLKQALAPVLARQIVASCCIIFDAITVPQEVLELARGSARVMLQCAQQRICVSGHTGDTLKLSHYDLFVVLKVLCILIYAVRR